MQLAIRGLQSENLKSLNWKTLKEFMKQRNSQSSD